MEPDKEDDRCHRCLVRAEAVEGRHVSFKILGQHISIHDKELVSQYVNARTQDCRLLHRSCVALGLGHDPHIDLGSLAVSVALKGSLRNDH